MESVLEPQEALTLYLFKNFVGKLPVNYSGLSFNKFKGTNSRVPFTYLTVRWLEPKEEVLEGEEELTTVIKTFSIPTVWYNRLFQSWSLSEEEAFKDWSDNLEWLGVEDESIKLLKEQGCSKLINPYFSHMYSHDLLLRFAKVTEEFKTEFTKYLAAITDVAKKLNSKSIKKDHDLILSFKANHNFTQLITGLNIIPPKLPEEQVFIGDTPVSLEAWEKLGHDKSVLTIIKRVVVLSKNANNLITHTKTKLKRLNKKHTESFLKAFDITVKEALLSSSHFMTPIYEFNTDDGLRQLEAVASQILNVLDKYKSNIGLDLNEWVCYEYNAGKAPVKMLQVELDFKDSILNAYTDSFIKALYDYLLKIEHRAIKPYDNRTVVTEDDGIKIGEMRVVKD